MSDKKLLVDMLTIIKCILSHLVKNKKIINKKIIINDKVACNSNLYLKKWKSKNEDKLKEKKYY